MKDLVIAEREKHSSWGAPLASLVARALMPAAPRLVSALVPRHPRNLHPRTHFLSVFSSRRLPHIHPPGKWLFLTWHLHGSLPQGRYPPPSKTSAGKAFVWMDRYLDQVRTGPVFLKQPELASMIVNALDKGVTLGHYKLGSFVVMSNHVHVLLLPLVATSRLLQSLKGATAREANRMLTRTGKPFWQAESYDHWVRDEEEYRRIAKYIENNPVKAGLAEHAEGYPWSSATRPRLDSLPDTADADINRTNPPSPSIPAKLPTSHHPQLLR